MEGSTRLRDLVLMPLILVYMAWLVLGAWPAEIRPSWLDPIATRAHDTLETIGLRAGIPVFAGSLQKMSSIIEAYCLEVVGTDAGGTETPIYPSEACPPRGLRWRPVIYDHMIFHWFTTFLDRPSNLLAMGAHFCDRSRDHAPEQVEITRVMHMVNYRSGHRWRRRYDVGRVECRP